MGKNQVATAVAPQNLDVAVIDIAPIVEVQKIVRISLTQENKAGNQNASFMFSSKGENLSEFVTDTAKKIVGVMGIQNRIKDNGGKANVFGLTKGGQFFLSISVTINDERNSLLSNFAFTLAQLGTVNPETVLIDYVEGFKLLTE